MNSLLFIHLLQFSLIFISPCNMYKHARPPDHASTSLYQLLHFTHLYWYLGISERYSYIHFLLIRIWLYYFCSRHDSMLFLLFNIWFDFITFVQYMIWILLWFNTWFDYYFCSIKDLILLKIHFSSVFHQCDLYAIISCHQLLATLKHIPPSFINM